MPTWSEDFITVIPVWETEGWHKPFNCEINDATDALRVDSSVASMGEVYGLMQGESTSTTTTFLYTTTLVNMVNDDNTQTAGIYIHEEGSTVEVVMWAEYNTTEGVSLRAGINGVSLQSSGYLGFEPFDIDWKCEISNAGNIYISYQVDGGGWVLLYNDVSATKFLPNSKAYTYKLRVNESGTGYNVLDLLAISITADVITKRHPDTDIAFTLPNFDELDVFIASVDWTDGDLDIVFPALIAPYGRFEIDLPALRSTQSRASVSDVGYFLIRTGITGNTPDTVDGIDPTDIEGTGQAVPLYSACLVIEADDTATLYVHKEEAGAVSDPPNIIIPATNPGDHYWEKTNCPNLTPTKLFSQMDLRDGETMALPDEYCHEYCFPIIFDTLTSGGAAIKPHFRVTPGTGLYAWHPFNAHDYTGYFNVICASDREVTEVFKNPFG